jgi:hypothetical protein
MRWTVVWVGGLSSLSAPDQLEPRAGGRHARSRTTAAGPLAGHHVHVLQHHAGALLGAYAHAGLTVLTGLTGLMRQ